ncbi:uncharacterized protein A1O9_05758 [Exophiala aquamarina CBS 119918]|uniref:Tyrosine specific protein phosphatases domain-containing protein n=1 Tax=Exophiala aquamarina CBS 119918 TaxID=1182545 RepID=A0A072PDL3_9EURO|nr:uncharacterized protein A1O9_05758 [Exophiala aquamarina CBS 119918]KEF57837.1 hypothetical protein A1O9_05758 [Exophiala aquamarina CBS 119918]
MAADHQVSVSSSYTQSFPYSDKRQFESPRVHVPPPILDYKDGKPSFIVAADEFEHISTDYGNPVFLDSIRSCHSLHMIHSMLSWRYEMRRAAQPVLPYLYLGPSSAARDPISLRASGITLMVAVRSTKAVQARPAFLNPASFVTNSGISTISFDFDSTYDFVSKLRLIVRAVNEHLEQTCVKMPVENVADIGGKVLVFCESGNNRSPVLVAAYLMIIYGVSAFSAIQVIQSQRFCITMSDDLKNVLLDLQHILEAQRTVSASRTGSVEVPGLSGQTSRTSMGTKRNLDDMDTSDEDMGADSPADDVSSREGVAPFADPIV